MVDPEAQFEYRLLTALSGCGYNLETIRDLPYGQGWEIIHLYWLDQGIRLRWVNDGAWTETRKRYEAPLRDAMAVYAAERDRRTAASKTAKPEVRIGFFDVEGGLERK